LKNLVLHWLWLILPGTYDDGKIAPATEHFASPLLVDQEEIACWVKSIFHGEGGLEKGDGTKRFKENLPVIPLQSVQFGAPGSEPAPELPQLCYSQFSAFSAVSQSSNNEISQEIPSAAASFEAGSTRLASRSNGIAEHGEN